MCVRVYVCVCVRTARVFEHFCVRARVCACMDMCMCVRVCVCVLEQRSACGHVNNHLHMHLAPFVSLLLLGALLSGIGGHETVAQRLKEVRLCSNQEHSSVFVVSA